MNIISPLDTERFGFPIAKFNPDNASHLQNGIASLEGTGCKLLICKVPMEQLPLIHQMQDLGFRTMDVQSTYAFDLKQLGETHLSLLNKGVSVAPYQAYQQSAIADIARISFTNYGHYAASGKLDPKKCTDIYVDWALRSCVSTDVADVMLVAEIDGVVAGFLGMKIFESPKGRYASSSLGAVSDNFRGRDVFRILTVHNLIWGKEKGLEWEEHNVLCTNYPVNRSFAGLGFKITRSFTTMHLWM